ncbi:hypothetical protein Tco_0658243, partial [Tanacetum coccineum]
FSEQAQQLSDEKCLAAGAHERLSAPDFTIEYKDFGDVAYGLRFFVERLTAKSENFDEYVQ